jgi:hypothetical protein
MRISAGLEQCLDDAGRRREPFHIDNQRGTVVLVDTVRVDAPREALGDLLGVAPPGRQAQQSLESRLVLGIVNEIAKVGHKYYYS